MLFLALALVDAFAAEPDALAIQAHAEHVCRDLHSNQDLAQITVLRSFTSMRFASALVHSVRDELLPLEREVDAVFGPHATTEELRTLHAEIQETITQLVDASRRLSDDSRALTPRISELALLVDNPLRGRARRQAREECAEHVFAIEMTATSLATLSRERHEVVQGMIDELVLKYRHVLTPTPSPSPAPVPSPPTRAIITFSPAPVIEPAAEEPPSTRRPFGPQP